MITINHVYNKDAVSMINEIKESDLQVDLTLTSPPYDNLREYDNNRNENVFDFRPIVKGLFDITADGGVVVWVVGDATIKGSETGNSFRQALYFQEVGFNIHDTMIYEKNSPAYPASRKGNRYTQIFEYMFVFSKGKPKSSNLICDKKNKWAGVTSYDGKIPPVPETSPRNNIWKYTTSTNKHKKFGDGTGHPAVFPEQLAEEHILTWSNEGDLVFDPMCGSGTTLEMAMLNQRHFLGSDLSEIYCNISKERIGTYLNHCI